MSDESLTNNSPEEPTLKPGELPDLTEDEFTGRESGQRLMKTLHGVEFPFRWCPAGTFMMGSPKSEKGRDIGEKRHSVTLSQGFWMMETQVTVGMYRAFAAHSDYHSQGDTPYGWTGRTWKSDACYSWENPGFSLEDTYPVTCVSWADAVAFCNWLGKQLGRNVQLPTEAQWEYACRAGTSGMYSGDLDAMGWHHDNSDLRVHRVAQKKPNDWGLYDMHGNVGEWCSDGLDTYPSSAVTDPKGSESDLNRVTRGGCWVSYAQFCRCAHRISYSSVYRGGHLGFRVSIIPDK